MPFDFNGLYEFHGHACPMSTMGARLGLAAMAVLGVSKKDQFLVEGHYMTRNCAIDGIQYTTGCTFGNGNLSFEESGEVSFRLRFRSGGREVVVSASGTALSMLAGHKKRKAELLKEREISGAVRSADIDAEIDKDFNRLVQWVQTADERELMTVSPGAGGLRGP
ncbi:MAG: FmdE family protein [Nitrospirota bacterium]